MLGFWHISQVKYVENIVWKFQIEIQNTFEDIGNENYHRGQRGTRVAKQIWPAVVYIFLQMQMDNFTKNIKWKRLSF